MRKFKLKIALLTFLVIFLTGFIIIGLTNFQVSNLILEGFRGNLNLSSQILCNKIINVIEGKEDNLKYLANLYLTRDFLKTHLELKNIQLLVGTPASKISEIRDKLAKLKQELEKFLVVFYGNHPFYSDIRIISLDGWELVHLKNGEVIKEFWDVSRTDLFKKISSLKKGEFYRSEMVLENTPSGRDYTIYLGAPIIVSDQVKGFITSQVSLVSMSNYLVKNVINPRSFFWLVDENGHLLVHPEAAKIGEEISKVAEGEIKQFIKSLLLGESGQVSLKINGEKSFLVYRPLNYRGWKMLILIPEKGLLLSLLAIYWKQLLVVIFAFLVLIFGLFKFVEKEYHQPLKNLTEKIKVTRSLDNLKEIKEIKESNETIKQIFNAIEPLFEKFKEGHKAEVQTKEQVLSKDFNLIEEKYQRVMKIARAFLELAPENNLKKTLKRILDDLAIKLKIKSLAIILIDKIKKEEIIRIVQGLESTGLKTFEELKSHSYEINFHVTENIKGILYLLKHDLGIDETEKEFLEKLTARVGKVIQEVIHYEEKIIAEAVAFEKRQAKMLKEKFFKINYPEVPNLKFGSVYLPAEGVGGSFFDFVSFPEDDYLDIFFAEIPGEGLKVAIELGVLKGLIRSRALAGGSSLDIVNDVNRVIFDEYPEMIPVSLSYNMINLKNKTISTVNVGEGILAYFQRENKKLSVLKPDLLGLGSQRQLKITSRKIIFTPNGVLMFLNKGFLKFYGIERLKIFLDGANNLSLNEMASALKEDLLLTLNYEKLPADILVLFLA